MKMRKRTVYPILPLLALLWLGLSFPLSAQPLFDVHLHYNAREAEVLGSEQLIAILDQHRVSRAVVIGQPGELAMTLHRHAPDRIVPFLGIYRDLRDKIAWPLDESLPARVEASLKQGHWRGLGELHIFANNRNRLVFHQLLKLAEQYQLVVMIHGDAAVIDTIYEVSPGLKVIWAHAGAYPYPSLLKDYLSRYPELYIDLSMRNERIAPEGRLTEDWYELFMEHPDRILLGMDTFSLNRWQGYGTWAAETRHWLAQLPDDIAAMLAWENAEGLFAHPKTKS
ncbi:MAG: amidohydrolase [Gammaproteobacteria bacterium]|nr:amidohydrolase [Gammaproteobacteria bacterium]